MHYFDNAATTFPKPEVVYEAMDNFYRTYGVNVGRGQFKSASVAAKLVEDTRKMILELFHAPYGYSCVFTPSATEAINVILQGLNWNPKMTVYISPFEHNAVLRTLNSIANKNDIDLRVLNPKKDFIYDMKEIRQCFLKKKPDVVVLTHASNVFGNVNPVEQIFSIAKEFNAVTVCDMAQTAGLVDLDFATANIDYGVFAGHKTLYGPFGIAGFITKKTCDLSPLIFGGTGIDSKNPNMPEEMPTKYEAGSHNIQAISGLNSALQWIKNTGIQNIRNKEIENTNQLLQILYRHKNITVLRSTEESTNIGVVSCVFNGYSSDNIGQVLSDFDIAVRTGLHCAPLAHEYARTAPDGTVRLSLGYFNSDSDFEKLEKALQYIELEG